MLESILPGGGWGTGAESRWGPVEGAGRGTVAGEWRGTGRGQCAVTVAASGRDILAEGGRGSVAVVAGGRLGTETSIRCFLALSAVTDNDVCFLLALGAG